MSEDYDYDYFYHPEDIPGNDEVPDFDEEFEEALRQYYEEEDSYGELDGLWWWCG